MNGQPWSEAEDAAVLDLSRTPTELAATLGRSNASISSRRSRLLRGGREPGRDAGGAMRMPRGWGGRLIAKSCSRCGEFLMASEFVPRRDGGRDSRCRACHSASVTDRLSDDEAYRRRFNSHVLTRQRTLQREAASRARNARKEWTGPELELVMRRDLTDKQKAQMLGRSFYAVRHMIRKINSGDPVKTHLAGLGHDAEV